jgi:chorismate mutase
MNNSNRSSESLRRQVDTIDDQLHDLLMARHALTIQMGSPHNPGLEAAALRRLAGRHGGEFPRASLVRIWRELMGASPTAAIAVAQPERGCGFIELARNHFGVAAPVFPSPSAGQVVKSVSEGRTAFGVVPRPGRGPGGAEPWWVTLTAENKDIPRVVVRLPIIPFESTAGRAEPLSALVIAKAAHEDTGQDRTMMVVESAAAVSRDRVRALVAAAGFEPAEVLGAHPLGDGHVHLVEVEGFVKGGDARLKDLVREPIRHASIIGGYPVPLTS